MRFARFLTVGGTSFVVQLLTIWLLGKWMVLELASVLSWLSSTGTHYCLNRFWALPSGRQDSFRQFREYVAVALISLAIQISFVRLCVNHFGLHRVWATAIAVPPSTVVVFLILNYRVFRAKKM